jgi:hypothetical protein
VEIYARRGGRSTARALQGEGVGVAGWGGGADSFLPLLSVLGKELDAHELVLKQHYATFCKDATGKVRVLRLLLAL